MTKESPSTSPWPDRKTERKIWQTNDNGKYYIQHIPGSLTVALKQKRDLRQNLLSYLKKFSSWQQPILSITLTCWSLELNNTRIKKRKMNMLMQNTDKK